MSALFHLGKPSTYGALGLNAFNHPLAYQVSYAFPPPALVPLVLSKFLAECVTSQFRLPILVTPCWKEAPWLPTVLNILADVPHGFPIIKDLIMDVPVGWMLKGVPLLSLTLWLLRHLCCTDKGSLPQSVRQWLGVT